MPVTATTASTLDFGTSPVGQKSTQSVTLTVDTDGPVTLSISGAGFSVKAPANSIAASGTTTSFTIEFAAPSVGSHSGALKSGTTTVVSLTGVGVAGAVVDATDGGDDNSTVDAAEINRYRIYVPTTEASLVMGKGHESMATKTASGGAVDGFGIQTKANVFLQAQGGHSPAGDAGFLFAKAHKSATIWADGTGSTSDAPESLLLYQANSNGKAIFTSKGAAYVTGDAGVVIDGGLDLLFKPSGGGIDPKPDTSRIDDFTKAFTIADITLAAVLGGDAAWSAIQDFRQSTAGWGTVTAGLAAIGGGGGALIGGLGVGGILSGTTIYGHAGVSLLSPGYTAIYGLPGVGIFSAFPTMLGMVDTTVMALHSVAMRSITGTSSVTGKEISLEASNEITIEASKGKHATGGRVDILGGRIAIGAEGTPSQKPATRDITLMTQDADTWVDIDGAAKAVKVYGGSNAKLKAGDHYVRVDKDKKSVFLGTDAGAQIDVEEKKITLYADDLEWKNVDGSIKQGNGGLKITGSKIDIN